MLHSLQVLQLLHHPRQKGQARGIKKTVRNHAGPDGAVQDHNHAEKKANHGDQRDGQHTLRKMPCAEKERCDRRSTARCHMTMIGNHDLDAGVHLPSDRRFVARDRIGRAISAHDDAPCIDA